MQTSRLSTTFLLLVAAAPCTAQQTWFVWPGGLTMPAAISAASPGDRIMVMNLGSIPSFLLDKGLDISTTYQTTVPTIEVVGVPVGQSARVAGFRPESVSVRNCTGTLLLENVSAGGIATTPLPVPALEILGSAAVFVSGGFFRPLPTTLAGGSPAIRIDGSQVFLSNGIAVGGLSVSQAAGVGGSGGTGVEVVSGDVMIGDYHIEGSVGYAGAIAGGNGGIGLHVLGGQVLVAASVVQGGAGGSGATSGIHGIAAQGNLRRTADTALMFGASPGVVTVPARPYFPPMHWNPVTSQLTIFVNGMFNPNALVFLGLDLAHGHVPVPAFDGAIALTASAVLTVVPLNSGGAGTLTLSIPFVPSGYNLNLFAQGITDVGGALVLTAPAAARIP